MEHTKGKATVSFCKEDLDSFEVNLEHSKGIDKVCRTTFNLFYKEEAKANAELIADAFNTTDESGLAPSQLYKQNQELLEALKEIAEAKGRYPEDRMTHAENTISDMVYLARQAINNAKTK